MQAKIDAEPKRTQKKSDTRKVFVDRVADDLTFKADTTPEQREAWQWIRLEFQQAEQTIREMLETSPVQERVVVTNDYDDFKKALRKTERWCNTAVANDWTPASAFDTVNVERMEYPIEADKGLTEKQRLCHNASSLIFILGTTLARYLPEGRALSVFATEIQSTRGELLDAINFNIA